MDRMKNEIKAAASEAVTQATARRTTPFPLSKLSSHQSKIRTRQSFVTTESENEHLSDGEAVAKGARQKRSMKCSPKQSRATTKPRLPIKKLHWTKSSVYSSSSNTEASEQRPKKTHSRGSEARKTKSPPDWDSSSSSDTESRVRTEKPKHLIKPPKYDGMSSFETFLVSELFGVQLLD